MAGVEQTFDITTQVGNVEQQVKGNKTPYVVVLSGGVDKLTGTQVAGDEFVDWKKNIGPKAMALQGQPQVDARVKIKFTPKRDDPNDFWENKEILDIAPLGGLPPQAMPVAGGTVAQPVQPQIPQAAPPMASVPQQVAQMPPQQPQMPPQQEAAQGAVVEMMQLQRDKEAVLTRQGAVRAAVDYVGACARAGMYDGATDADQSLKQRILELTAFVSTGSFNPAAEQDAKPTPEQLAAGVPGVQVGVPYDTQPQEGGEEAS